MPTSLTLERVFIPEDEKEEKKPNSTFTYKANDVFLLLSTAPQVLSGCI